MLYQFFGVLILMFCVVDLGLGYFGKTEWLMERLWRTGPHGRKLFRRITSPAGRVSLIVTGLLVIGYGAWQQPSADTPNVAPRLRPQMTALPAPPPTAAEIAEAVKNALPKPETTPQAAASLPPPNIVFVERDPESWGYPYGTPVILDRSRKFRMLAGTMQRFNPQLGNPIGLNEAILNVFAFISFPTGQLELVQVPSPWQVTESNRPNSVTYYADFDDLNQSVSASSPAESAWTIRAVEPGTFDVRWNITGSGQRSGSFPAIQGRFEIEAYRR